MSFFIKKKGKGRKNEEKVKRTSSEVQKARKDYVDNISAKDKFSIDDSEDEEVEDATSSDEELAETTQEKKLRLAQKYLEEIEAQERERAEDGIVDKTTLENRLRGDYLEETGRLRKAVADEVVGYNAENVKVLRSKEQNLPITCIVVSADSKHIFSGSKDASIVKWQFGDCKKLGVIPSSHRAPEGKKSKYHKGRILCLAISSDNEFLASGDDKNAIHIWNPTTLEHLHTFKDHKGPVTGLAFRWETHQLFSVSSDRCVRVWSLDEMACVETLFGHQSAITAIDAMSRERAVTSGGRDNSIRVWKIAEESQLVFNGTGGGIDCVRLLDEQHFFSGTDGGMLSVWSAGKKKPLCNEQNAHGRDEISGEPNWISSVACLINTDLLASGSRNGQVSLWKCEDFRRLKPVMNIPVEGFINSMCFTKDGLNLVLGVGQEHRLGRWLRIPKARNSVVVIPLIRQKSTK